MSQELPATIEHHETMPAVPADMRTGIFGSIEAFEAGQRMAKMLSCSSIVPKSYQGQVADCVIAIDMAARLQMSPLAVMQSLYPVHGKPAWDAKALIGFLNQTRRFSPVRYEMFGEQGTDGRGCRASVEDLSGQVIVGPDVTIAIAKADGWYSRTGSKWQTIPELMLRYRAATWLCRLLAPELGMGLPTADEVIDVTPEREAVSSFEGPATRLLTHSAKQEE